MTVRFPRLAPETMTPAQREVAAEIAAGPRGEVRGPYIALIHNAELARRVQQLGEHLRWHSKLPPALLELAVLVTAREWNCQHEWYMHEKLARKAGLAPGIFEAIGRGKEPQGMSPDEALVYGASRQAHRTGRLDDATFAAARTRFGLDGTLELLALNGYYSMMAMVLNTAGMPLPDDAAPPLQV
ncbi:MAG TPA: carboxymuconolactone decarboxylase family protein [Burkholderiales bacterium]|nr:carboxymuconolactone decarboxylase family protein [Burkholderiales bacterium]